MGKNKDTTLVDKALTWYMNNRVFAWIIVAAIVVIGIGSVAASIINITDLWERFRGESTPPSGSITVDLPDGLTFRRAVGLLAENDKASARFDPSCSSRLLDAQVKGGTIRARTTAGLIELLQNRLPTEIQQIQYKVRTLMDGGLYEVSCST